MPRPFESSGGSLLEDEHGRIWLCPIGRLATSTTAAYCGPWRGGRKSARDRGRPNGEHMVPARDVRARSGLAEERVAEQIRWARWAMPIMQMP